MAIRLYNSLSRTKEEFRPLQGNTVTMYVCGPTVYSLSHIGHARSAVSFDVIYRYLRYRGYDVRYARNYTDVDDKIINRAIEEKRTPDEVARDYIRAYDEDMAALGVELPTFRPKATETIGRMIGVIQGLIAKGFAYELDGDVYYSVRSFGNYGRLSGKNIEELEAGARVEVDERKKDPLDFALWKKAKPGEPSWESPWGQGRPGWHIECTAMSQSLLGETIDIHGGGKDLIFPHHENEIAQSEAHSGRTFARYWLHNGFVNIEKEKMSKSLGNILNIRDALRGYTAEALRLFILSSHYRSPVEYSEDTLRDAESAAERFYRTIGRMDEECPDAVAAPVNEQRKRERLLPILHAMDDDFNTALAIGKLFEEVSEANRLMDEAKNKGFTREIREGLSLARAVFKEVSPFLGVFQKEPARYFEDVKKGVALPVSEIERLIKERNEARERKDFKRSDAIRDELKKHGVALEDTPRGTVWKAGPPPTPRLP